VPIIKYDARAGRVFRVDRVRTASGWEAETIEITKVFQAVMDLENIRHGWLSFPTNDAPDIVTVKLSEPMPARPSKGHRAGFQVYMLLGKTSGGDVREMAANAKVSIDGMDELHNAYLKEAPQHPGELPVVVLSDTRSITSGGKDATGRAVSSTNYQPVWSIQKWVPRPSELPANGDIRPPPGEHTDALGGPAQQQAPAREPVLSDF
jgi:hypothetical protein